MIPSTRLLPLMVGAFLLLSSCKDKFADMILINGIIHTVDEQGSVVQACAIKDGKIVATGRSEDLMFDYESDTVLDLRGKVVYPGFIDAHCHFYGYAMTLNQVNLVGTTSWEEVVDKVDSFAVQYDGEWIVGRGWDQNDWQDKDFPTNRLLNQRFPNRPVLLKRVDGHAAIANAAALKLAGVTRSTRVSGGRIARRGGRPSGLLVDNAVDLVEDIIPEATDDEIKTALMKAERNLFSVGLTTVDDAGLDRRVIELMEQMHKDGDLRIRVYAMANPNEENLEHYLPNGPHKTDRMHVRSFKIYADGALGSRGACLLRSYKDAPGNVGFLLKKPDYYEEIAQQIYDGGYQMNTHCIGDSANRMITRIYGNVLGGENDRRWRVEHAQVVNLADFRRFADFDIIPSVQPVHATSDMYWAEDRVGKTRLKGAYAYKSLFAQNERIAFGSDFPVEDINPLLGFYAAVSRMDLERFPYGGFLKEQALGRDTCLRAMTIWAAHANFEEKEKGSIEVDKFADLVVMNEDILFMEEKQLPYAQVELTILNGEIVFSAEE